MDRAFRALAFALVMVAVPKAGVRGVALAEGVGATAQKPAATTRVPRLVDLGAGKCIPCKAMAPILEELRVEYAGRMEVQFIDVWKDPDSAKPYGIHIIPTQIFYGPDGKELARHQGFISKEQILAQWKAVGVRL
jgi:thioredoxin 1